MYLAELEIKDTTESITSASCLDFLLSIGRDGQLHTSVYDKRDNFNFHTPNFLFLSSNFPSLPAFCVFISQLLRYARACSSYECFIPRARWLSSKLLKQGYLVERLKSSFRKFHGRYGDLIQQYGVSLSRMLNGILNLDQLHCPPNRSGFPPISWPWYRAWPLNDEWFPRSIWNGCGMPAGNAYPFRHLVPSPFLLCPRHKMARGHLVFALSVLPSFRHSVASKFVFSTPTSLHGFEWNLAGMLYHMSRSACGEVIHVRQISAELWPLTLRIFTHFSLSSQLPLHPCMDLNETWQGCCTTSLEVHVGRYFMFDKFWQSYGPWHLEFLHILACLLNSSYILAWIWMKLGNDVVPQVLKCM